MICQSLFSCLIIIITIKIFGKCVNCLLEKVSFHMMFEGVESG